MQIRVYYLSRDNIVSEVWQDYGGKWYDGELNQTKTQAIPESRLAVVGKTWDDIHMSVYYQRPDGGKDNILSLLLSLYLNPPAIGEMKRDGKNNRWIQGATSIGDRVRSHPWVIRLPFSDIGT